MEKTSIELYDMYILQKKKEDLENNKINLVFLNELLNHIGENKYFKIKYRDKCNNYFKILSKPYINCGEIFIDDIIELCIEMNFGNNFEFYKTVYDSVTQPFSISNFGIGDIIIIDETEFNKIDKMFNNLTNVFDEEKN